MKKVFQLFAVTFALSAILGSGFYGWPAYRKYKQHEGMRNARAFLSARDIQNASLSARQVIQINPRNQEACNFMAELSELSGLPSALDWRLRAVEADQALTNQLKLISCALRFERPPYALAHRTLLAIEPVSQASPTFHALQAQFALQSDRLPEAIDHLRTAAHLQPENILHRFNLSVLELQYTNTAGAARTQLEALASRTDLGAPALRWLVLDALHRNALEGAKGFSDRLLGLPWAGWDDRLRHLTILQCLSRTSEPQGTDFTRYLSAIQSEAQSDGVKIYGLCEWMSEHGLIEMAQRWVDQLDVSLTRTPPVAVAAGKLCLLRADWPSLQARLEGADWGEQEFLRLALLARAAWGRNNDSLANVLWGKALTVGNAHLAPLMNLAALAEDWGKDPDEVLWAIVQRFPHEQWALRKLESRYIANGNTRQLNRVYSSLLSRTGCGQAVSDRNLFACTSLLLGVNVTEAHRMARELYAQQPQDAVIVTTYAFSLHIQGRTDEALGLFAKLDVADLKTPPVALYYGVLLANAGKREEARSYLALATRAVLLPEEKALLQFAKSY